MLFSVLVKGPILLVYYQIQVLKLIILSPNRKSRTISSRGVRNPCYYSKPCLSNRVKFRFQNVLRVFNLIKIPWYNISRSFFNNTNYFKLYLHLRHRRKLKTLKNHINKSIKKLFFHKKRSSICECFTLYIKINLNVCTSQGKLR